MEKSPIAALIELGRKAREAETARELQFLLVNDSHSLAPYRQAALWLHDGGARSMPAEQTLAVLTGVSLPAVRPDRSPLTKERDVGIAPGQVARQKHAADRLQRQP